MLDNKVVLTPCVLFSELLTQWAEATLLLRLASLFFAKPKKTLKKLNALKICDI